MGRADVLSEFAKSAPPNAENGAAFYQHLFERKASLKDLFKGAEDIAVEEVGQSELFRVLGEKVLVALFSKLATAADDDDLLNRRCCGLITLHKKFNMRDAGMWDHVPKFLLDFFKTRLGLTLTEDEVEAWNHVLTALATQAHVVLDQPAPTN